MNPESRKSFASKLKAFRNEISIWSKVYHPNVCLFMGAVTDVENVQIVTELMRISVEHLLLDCSKHISLLERLHWAKDAAQGMAWLHAQHIVHYDFKTANLLIDEFGTVKVCDFGFAAYFSGRGMCRGGSAAYSAPEVLLNKDDKITPKVDVYSFGITLWELVTREQAFGTYDDRDLFIKALTTTDMRPRIDTTMHPKLVSLLGVCWHTNPEQRPTFPDVVEQIDTAILDIAIPDKNGRELWRNLFVAQGIVLERVEWEEFIRAFCENMQLKEPPDLDVILSAKPTEPELDCASVDQLKEFAQRNPCNFRRVLARNCGLPDDYDYDLLCLKLLLATSGRPNSGEEDVVTIEQFGKILGFFGPLEIPYQEGGFLDKIHAVVRQDWFHGFLSAEEAQTRLRKQPEGTFLIRFSTRSPATFVLSLVVNGQIKETQIPYNNEKQVFVIDKKPFPSLKHLIYAYRSRLVRPCPESLFASLKYPLRPYEDIPWQNGK